jgi:hypothetical protein
VARALGTTIRLSWEAADDQGAAVQAYELEAALHGSDGAFTPLYRGEGTSCRAQQLAPDSSYRFRVRGVNAGEESWAGWDDQPDCFTKQLCLSHFGLFHARPCEAHCSS